MNAYDPKEIEKKWQEKWKADALYTTSESPKEKKAYILDMFPYPSGEGLHVGHPKGYIASDVLSRMKRMQGYDVLHPMGFDSFGLPAENYAIKHKRHPREFTERNIKRYNEQLTALGFDYDPKREISTCDPMYYRWTQWIFIQLLKRGLAYESHEPINWCPSCKTGLANEDLQDGKCERCGSVVEKKPLRQWVLKITDYAERLLADIDTLDWPESVKAAQRAWIGKSEGHEVEFRILPTPALPSREGEIGYHTTETKIWKQLQNRVLEMRKNPTQAENILWNSLRGNLTGYHFRQQHVIGTFIVDFVCLAKNLVIEIDGDIHDYQKDDDALRTTFLTERGFTVLRFTNDEIIKNLSAVVKKIVASLSSLPSGEGKGGEESVRVFTTRLDTLYGATYLVLAPEHALVAKLQDKIENYKEVKSYVETSSKKQEIERTAEEKEKTGVELKGIKAVNPANGEEIPVWIGDYVLANYGTGAIMAVPAHDERDFAFARKYKLPIKQVIAPEFGEKRENEERRDGGGGIIFDPKTQRYAFLRQTTGRLGVFGGGVGRDEDLEEGITREMIEESGLYDFKHVEKIVSMFAHYRNTLRNVNRSTHTTCFLFILNSTDTREVQHEQHETYTLDWATPEEVLKNWSDPEFSNIGLDHWRLYLQQAVGRAIELGYDTTSDPKKFYTSAYGGEGLLINSAEFSELTTNEAREKIAEKVGAQKKITYKLRDWVFSRQRYWGEPIPVIHCLLCGAIPVDEGELPVELPEVENYEPTGTGESPLAAIEEWVNTICPQCGGPGKRETNTMPGWAGSSWYYIAYAMGEYLRKPESIPEIIADPKLKKVINTWLPVDVYEGGSEHITRHMLYARFWHKFLCDIEFITAPEPFIRYYPIGLILANDGRKMSKRWGNVVNPDDMIARYGADSMRLYEMFMGPFENAIAWSEEGIVGARRFTERVWNLQEKLAPSPSGKAGDEVEILLNQTIKKVTENIAEFKLNTAISSLMILVNELTQQGSLDPQTYKILVKLLAPFTPHVAEELWLLLNPNTTSVHAEPWPMFDTKKLESETAELVIQINGKVRGRIIIQRRTTEKEATNMAYSDNTIKKWLGGGEPRKIIYIPDKLLNIVV